MTRSNKEGEIGFVADTRRMNVAMTRARMLLVVVGDSATIGNFPYYSDFIEYSQSIDSYKSAWEFL
jgi:superfamily I DNA and/or RNA helicase